MYNYFLSEDAEEDFWRIYEYGRVKFGLLQADKYFNMMQDSFERIASNPFMFPEAIDYKGVDRFCVCGVDKIFYNIVGSDIEIITIIGRQDY